jgi:NAD(P) transhydrogenase subunit alpha
MSMKIGVPKEVHEGERRVALTPAVAQQIQKFGYTLAIESGAGDHADFDDASYANAGVEVLGSAKEVWDSSDIVMKVRAPEDHPSGMHETEMMREGQTLMSFVWPAQNPELMDQMAARKGNVIAMDMVPRISRAQKLDALSSMANIAGYRAVIEAANHFGRFFTGQITAAGKVPPAKVMVIGAGVAGLAAIGAARGLGAIVRAFDTRPEVKQQVESMGAEFLMMEFEEDGSGGGGYAKVMSDEFIAAEMALFREQCKEVDIIITTALIPGRPAPKLILADMVEILKPGSVIVDLASEQGGNCELTEPGEVVVKHGVTIIGHVDLPSRLAAQSSQLYASNLRHFLDDLTPEKDGQPNHDMDDVVIRGSTVIKDGGITYPPPPVQVSAPPKPAVEKPKPVVDEKGEARKRGITNLIALAIGAAAMIGLGSVAPPDFMAHFTVFVLACFVGYQVIWNVTPALHTPLMAVTNAISGIIVIGALLQVSNPSWVVWVLAFIAVLIATINIVGGFMVTQRMLGMFRKD